jgi:hypothetical protein
MKVQKTVRDCGLRKVNLRLRPFFALDTSVAFSELYFISQTSAFPFLPYFSYFPEVEQREIESRDL